MQNVCRLQNGIQEVEGIDVMSVENQWALLRGGDIEQGLTLMQESFNGDPTPSTLVTLGLGYLWAEKYEAAWKHFQHWMDRYQVTMDAYFTLVGVAQWCLDDPITASESWRLGLRALNIDMAGGIESPLLLWVASVLRPNDIMRREAIQILRKKVKNPKVRHWPGPLAQFVLGQIDEVDLNERSKERLSQEPSPRREWEIKFYKSIFQLERGGLNRSGFEGAMQGLVDTSAPEWSDEKSFLQLVRNPEFYIARHEASILMANEGGTDLLPV